MFGVLLAIFKKSGPYTMSESFAYAACMTRKALLSLSRQVLTQAMHTRTHTEFLVLKAKLEAPKKILCMVPRPLSHKANI